MKKLNEKIVKSLLDDEQPVADHHLDWNPVPATERAKKTVGHSSSFPSQTSSAALQLKKPNKASSEKSFKELVQEYNQPRPNFSQPITGSRSSNKRIIRTP